MAVMQMQRVSICALKKGPEGHPGKAADHGRHGNDPGIRR